MKILLYSLNYHPELIGIAKYNMEMCSWLAAAGHQVQVVCAQPYYPQWKVAEGYRAYWYTKESFSGVQVHRCPVYVRPNPGGLTRILHLLSFCCSSLPVLLALAWFWRPEVIIHVEPTLFSAPTTIAARFFTRCKTLLHIQDFEIDAAIELGVLSRPAMRRLLHSFERSVMKHFDGICSISHTMLGKALARGPRGCKHHLLKNWCDLDALCILPEAKAALPDAFPSLGLSANDCVVLYSGNIGAKQGVESIVHTAEQITALPGTGTIHFLICGDGARRAHVQELAAGRRNVHFLPLQDRQRYNLLLNIADLHVLPQQQGYQDIVMPSKLGSIVAVGGAVIAQANPGTEVHEAVSAAGGVIVAPGDAKALAEAIARLAKAPGVCARMREQARAYAVQELGKEAILSAFNDFLAKLVSCRT